MTMPLNVILNVVNKGKMSKMFRISGFGIDMEHKVLCTSCKNMGYLHNPLDPLEPRPTTPSTHNPSTLNLHDPQHLNHLSPPPTTSVNPRLLGMVKVMLPALPARPLDNGC